MRPFQISSTKNLVFFLIIFSVCVLAQTGKVVGVTDGDTMEMLIEGKSYKIRLAHIDAPEKKQAYGAKAKQHLSDLCYGKTATMTVTVIDRYKRNVAVVTLKDGTNVNKEMVKDGFAWWYYDYSKDITYQKLEKEARNAKRGLWADKNPVAPWKWRKPDKARRCQATTKKGTQCKRNAIEGSNYCMQHTK